MNISMKREAIFHCDPEILGGTPVFVGTRVPVDSLVDHLTHGITLDAFLDDFPTVSRAQATAFLEMAQHLLVASIADADSIG